MKHARPFVLALVLTAGCALKGDVRRVELQVEALRVERARADSQRASEIDTVRALLRTAQEKLTAQQAYLVQLRGDVKTDLLAVQQQLVSVQELTGQSQQRLTELRGRLEEQARQPVPVLDTSRGGAAVPVGPSGNPAGPGPEQMYDLAYQQYRASRYGTARLGFREFLRLFPTHERAPDALYFIGESFAGENTDSATPALRRPTSRATSSSAWGGSLSRDWGPGSRGGAGVSETRENRAEMPFLDHVEELRWRILYSLLAIVVGTLAGWIIVEHVNVIGLLMRPIAPLIPGGKLRVTGPTEPFFITLKFAFVLGLVIASPVVGYHVWAFLVPALYPRERRLIVPALTIGALLFLAGAAAASPSRPPRSL